MKRHIPVMKDECLRFITAVQPKRHLDCTLGAGGHARAIIEALPDLRHFIGVDADQPELEKSSQELTASMIEGSIDRPIHDAGAIVKSAVDLEGYSLTDYQMRQLHMTFVHGNFTQLPQSPSLMQYLIRCKGTQEATEPQATEPPPTLTSDEGMYGTFDTILADLGCSSMQMDSGERGFSFKSEAPLDMRMDRSRGEMASELIMRVSEDELGAIIRDYGEDRYWRLMARNICAYRTTGRIETTFDLLKAAGVWGLQSRRHPATRLFQALRIAVNRELELLAEGIERWLEQLSRGGRMVIITFHSLEDRIVKQTFRAAADSGAFTLITKKPIPVSEAEVLDNPRARSAKLRVIERSPSTKKSKYNLHV